MADPHAPAGALIPLASTTLDGAEVQTVDARELHAFLDVGRGFTTWMRERIETFGFREGADYVTFSDLSAPKSGSSKARPQRTTEYRLAIDMAKELAMLERSPKGREARHYFIECERRAKAVDPLAVLADPATLRALLLTASERELALQADNRDLGTKVVALDRLATAEAGSVCRTDAAKMLQVRPKELMDHLRARRWTYRRAGSADEVAYQDKLAAGLLEHKVKVVQRGDGSDRVCTTILVTPKGLARLGAELTAAKAIA